MIQINNVYKQYGNITVLNNVSTDIEDRKMVAILGRSGAGKSTLLHLIGTLDTPTQGSIFINNVEINQLQGKSLAEFRNKHIGFIFQFHYLLPEFTALENVCIPGWIAHQKEKPLKEKATQLLIQLGLKDKLERKPNQLSGGEQQRIAIARGLINNPSIILADEPTGNLDEPNALQLMELFIELQEEVQSTFIIVTHNVDIAKQCHHTLTIKDGFLIKK
ncbi:MAG: ABC transporter ATP-binding protein [Chitinophagaceae bacterium]